MSTTNHNACTAKISASGAVSVITYVVAYVFAFGASSIAHSAGPLDRAITLEVSPDTPLESALLQWSKAAGIQVMMSSETVAHERAHGVHGDASAGAVLSTLLKGTGLKFTMKNGTVLIVPSEAPLHPVQNRQSHSADLFISDNDVGSDNSAGSNRDSGIAEVIVTAQKRSESLQDVPISISVLGGPDLDRSAVSGVSEALNSVPGVEIYVTQGGGTQIVMRGATAGYYEFAGSSPVAYYLDSAPFGFVRTAIAPDASAYDLSQVEVLRGPQGTLYGANALNGVVRVLTNDADLNNFDFKARGSASTTDFGGGNYRGDAAVNIPIVPGQWAVRAVLGYDDLSGWINSQNATHVNSGQERNYRLKLNGRPTDDLSVAVSAWRTDDTYGAPSEGTEDGQNGAINAQPISVTYDVYGLKLEYQTPWFSVTSSSSYLDYADLATVDLLPYYKADFTYDTDLRSRVYSEELLLTSAADSRWIWTAGAFYRDGRDQTIQPLHVLTSSPPTTSLLDNFVDRSKSEAIYGEVGRKFANDALQWTLGGRYFHDDVTTQAIGEISGEPVIPLTPMGGPVHHFSPRAVLTWYADPDLTGYASYSQGFRSGIAQDEFVTFVAPAFPAAKPDTLNNYEIGFKGDLIDHRLAFDTSVYYIHWKDVQQVITVQVPGDLLAAATVNGSSASGFGTDIGLKAQLLDGLQASVSFSWNGLKQDKDVYSVGQVLFFKGERLTGAPAYTAGSSILYTSHLGSSGYTFSAGPSANFFPEPAFVSVVNNQEVVTHTNSMLNVRASASISSPGDHWTATLYGENLTDDRGSPYPNVALPVWSLRVRPRTVGIQLEYHFR